jgi:hypothetical protein
MRSDIQGDDHESLRDRVFFNSKKDSQIVTSGTCIFAGQFAPQRMCLQAGMQMIVLQHFYYGVNLGFEFRAFAD